MSEELLEFVELQSEMQRIVTNNSYDYLNEKMKLVCNCLSCVDKYDKLSG